MGYDQTRIGLAQGGWVNRLLMLLGIFLLCASFFVDWVYLLSSIGLPEKKLVSPRGQMGITFLRSFTIIIPLVLLVSTIVFRIYPQTVPKLCRQIESCFDPIEQSPSLTALFLLIVLLTKTVLQLGLYLVGFRYYAGDDFVRVMKADYWLQGYAHYHDFGLAGWLGHGSPWLPFPDYLLGLALAIHRDLYITPKIVNLGLSAIAVVVLYVLGRALFGRVAGLATALLFAFIPWHVWLGISGMTSDLFSMIMIALFGLSLLGWGQKGRARTLLLAAGCLFVANGIRYENWFFSLAFAGFLCLSGIRRWRRNDLPPRSAFLFGCAFVIALLFPITHMTISYLNFGEWLPAVQATDSFRVSSPKINMLKLTLTSYPFECVIIMAGILYAAGSDRAKSYRSCLFVVGATFLCFAIVFKMQLPIHGARPARNLLPYIVLLLPYGGFLMARLVQLAVQKQSWVALVSSCLLVLAIGIWDIGHAFKYPNPHKDETLYTGETLRMMSEFHRPPKLGRILLEKAPQGYIPFPIVVVEGKPERFVSLGKEGGDAACADGFQSEACKAYIRAGQFELAVLSSPRLIQSFTEVFSPPSWQIGRYHIFTLPAKRVP